MTVATDRWAYNQGRWPQIARVHDSMIRGKDNYAADRELADKILGICPTLRETALAGRQFMHQAVADLAHRGIRQFLDIGAGMPDSPAVHTTAQMVYPYAEVLYVEPDQLACVYGRALVAGSGIDWLQADLTDTTAVLDGIGASPLRLDEPIAVTAIFVTDYIGDAAAALRKLMDALASGSALIACQYTSDFDPDAMDTLTHVHAENGIPFFARTHEEIGTFFDGMQLVEPGLVVPNRWRPVPVSPAYSWDAIHAYAGVGIGTR